MTGPPPRSWAVDPGLASAREVAPGVWRLRLPLPWPGIDHVNAYVVQREDGVMLVDCGPGGDPSCVASLQRAIAQTGYGLGDIRALVLTHAHSDHSGLTRTVLEASGAELWAHPNLGHFYDVLHRPQTIAALRRRRARLEGVPARRLEAYADVREETEGVDGPITPHHALSDGMLIPSSVGAWEVLETPGHAPSHVSLIQRERGLVLAGDLVCIAFAPYMDYGCTPDPYAESVQSLERLAGQPDIGLTLPGHGRPLTELAAVISEHQNGFAARRDGVRQALRAGPLSSYHLAEQVHGAESEVAAVGHLCEILSILRHLRLRGEVSRSVVSGSHSYRLESGS